jgi:antitoxin CptB
MSEIDPHSTTRKRLLWRASHRGIKEMDMVIGGFAASRLQHMSKQELSAFEIILEIPDQELLAWVTGQEKVPADHTSPLLNEILAYRPALQS